MGEELFPIYPLLATNYHIMLLTIDIGNTNITLGTFKTNYSKAVKSPTHIWRIATNQNQTSDEYGSKILDFLRYSAIDRKDILDVLVASVVPGLNSVIQDAIKVYLKKTTRLIENTDFNQTNLKINVDNPSEVGADRLLNALATIEFFGGPAAVIDFGTAVTIDCINKKNEYIGGVIMPGPLTAINALSRNTAKLPRVEFKKPKGIIGKNTVECIQSGLYFGYVGGIMKFISEIKKELGSSATVIATGGLAGFFEKDLKEIKTIIPELTLEGMRILWNKIRGQRLEYSFSRLSKTKR